MDRSNDFDWVAAPFGFNESACLFCHTETAEKIHTAVFGSDFWFNLALMLLPFAICSGLTWLIYFGVPKWTHDGTVANQRRPTNKQAP